MSQLKTAVELLEEVQTENDHIRGSAEQVRLRPVDVICVFICVYLATSHPVRAVANVVPGAL